MALNGNKGEIANKGRMKFIISLCGFSLFVYLLFLFNLQVIHGFEYEKRARQVASRVLLIPAQRGEIYDRNFNIPLVTNIDSFAVSIIPAELSSEEIDSLFEKLANILNITVEKIKKEIPSNYYHLYQPIEIASGIQFETITYIAEHIEHIEHVFHNLGYSLGYTRTLSLPYTLREKKLREKTYCVATLAPPCDPGGSLL